MWSANNTQRRPSTRRAVAVLIMLLLGCGTDETVRLKHEADSLSRAKRYKEAIPRYKRYLELREKELGPDHPEVAITLNDLAELYHAVHDYANAAPLYQRALESQEQAPRSRPPRRRHHPQ